MNDLKKIIYLLTPKLKKKFIILVFLVLVGTILEMLSISFLFPILNILTDTTDSTINFLNKNNLSFLVPYLDFNKILLLFLGIYVCKILFRLYLIKYQNNFIFTFFTDLLNKLFRKYIFREYLFHIKNNSGILIKNLMTEIHQCAIGFMGTITNIIIESIIIICLISILINYKPYEVITFITFVAIIALIVILLLRKISRSLGKDRQKFDLRNVNNIMQSFGGIKEIILNSKQHEVISKFYLNSLNLKKVNYLFQVLNQIPRLILELLVVISIVGLLFYLVNSGTPSSEVILFFGILVGIFARVLPSIYKLSSSYINFSFYKPSVELLYKELTADNEQDSYLDYENNLEIGFKNKIEIKDISFKYPGTNNEILTKVNLTIHKGEKIGICGESGSGKSTLVDILVGLLRPVNGQILVDDKNIRLNIKNWYSKIGYVPQNVFLNDEDVQSNIIFYEKKNNIDFEKYNDAIKIAQLENFILNEKNKDNLNIGERGVQISGGQKQRIGLARSIYKDTEILIFDEATNALDQENESAFLNSVFNLKSNKTIIIISHKKNILEKCDKIYKIEEKKIIKI